MRITFVSPYYDQAVADPMEMLRRYPILRLLPPEVAAMGHTVETVLLSAAKQAITDRDVIWRFVRPWPVTRLASRGIYRWKPLYGPAYYQVSPGLISAIRASQPDVVHVFGMTIDLHLTMILRFTSARIVVHYHGGLPAIGRRRAIQRHNLSRVARALFTVASQAEPWIDAGLLHPSQVGEVLETSSPFVGIPRAEARRITGMTGDPIYLSPGRLHLIKDPLTTLRGFEAIAKQQPRARLYMYYLTDEMLPDVHAALNANPLLKANVELRGRAKPEEMEAIFSSADFLLQASVREWSGLAVLEAMSCGCIPIVTNIPSFTKITHEGRFGRLFPVGDAEGMASAALSVSNEERAALAHDVRTHFQNELSFAAIARQLDALYRSLHPLETA